MKVFECIPKFGLSDEEFKFNQKKSQYTYFPLINAEFGIVSGAIDIINPDLNIDNIKKLGDVMYHLQDADIVVLGKGWENDRICKLIMEIAEAFGKRIINLETNKI